MPRLPIPDEFGRFVPRSKVDDTLGLPWFKAMKKVDILKKEIDRVGPNSGKGKALARQIEQIENKMREMGAEVNANPRGARRGAEESIIKKEDWRRAGGKNAPKKAEARMETRARKRRETRKEYGIGGSAPAKKKMTVQDAANKAKKQGKRK